MEIKQKIREVLKEARFRVAMSLVRSYFPYIVVTADGNDNDGDVISMLFMTEPEKVKAQLPQIAESIDEILRA